MDKELSLNELRQEIDSIDRELVELFKKRMRVAAGVAQYKKNAGLPVLDAARERSLLTKVSDLAGEEFSSYTRVLYSTLMSLSRSYQHKLMNEDEALISQINEAIENTPKLFPEKARVACQGVEGAYSQIAAEKIFSLPDIKYYRSFDAVFEAIENGECQYGVLPIENSTAGSVTKIFDLILKHKFYIVRSHRLKIDHNLLALPGAKTEDIKEIFSHEQAINQCSEFLKAHPDIKVTPCANTAVAAQMVAQSGRIDLAALSSRHCASLYGLQKLVDGVQNTDNNHTRFICISKNLEIYPGAEKTTVMAITENRPGSLYSLLSHCFSQGINLSKLESRPLPDRDFEFMFYFDLEAPVYSPRLQNLLSELENQCEDFRYLGSFSEFIS